MHTHTRLRPTNKHRRKQLNIETAKPNPVHCICPLFPHIINPALPTHILSSRSLLLRIYPLPLPRTLALQPHAGRFDTLSQPSTLLPLFYHPGEDPILQNLALRQRRLTHSHCARHRLLSTSTRGLSSLLSSAYPSAHPSAPTHLLCYHQLANMLVPIFDQPPSQGSV